MTAETQVTANAVVPDATRADTAYLTALERITLQMTGKLQLEDVLATITHGLVEEFHAAFARLWLLGPGDLCTACYQAGDCANRERCLHLKASAGIYTNLNLHQPQWHISSRPTGRRQDWSHRPGVWADIYQ
jgi:uncharacterized protein YigA (DUF484 family)